VRRRRASAAAVALLGLGAAGCEALLPTGAVDLDSATVPGTTSYFVGEEYRGLPLIAAERSGPNRVLFVYGTCETEDPDGLFGPEGGSCTPPVQIQILPFDPDQWGAAVGCRRLAPLRGVPTVRHDGLVLFTEDTVVKIYAPSPIDDRKVAGALRRVGAPAEEASRDLPPPTFPEHLIARCR
jgi:hypothetical protein